MERIAYGFDRLPGTGIPVVAVHRYTMTAAGELAHYTDDRLRAVVPPAGLDDYARQWPDCAQVVQAIKDRPAPVVTMFTGPDATERAVREANVVRALMGLDALDARGQEPGSGAQLDEGGARG